MVEIVLYSMRALIYRLENAYLLRKALSVLRLWVLPYGRKQMTVKNVDDDDDDVQKDHNTVGA